MASPILFPGHFAPNIVPANGSLNIHAGMVVVAVRVRRGTDCSGCIFLTKDPACGTAPECSSPDREVIFKEVRYDIQ